MIVKFHAELMTAPQGDLFPATAFVDIHLQEHFRVNMAMNLEVSDCRKLYGDDLARLLFRGIELKGWRVDVNLMQKLVFVFEINDIADADVHLLDVERTPFLNNAMYLRRKSEAEGVTDDRSQDPKDRQMPQ